MNVYLPDPDLAGVCFLAVGGALLGLVGVLARSAPRGPWPLAALASALGGGAAAASALGQPRGYWLPAALLAGVCAAFLGLRSRWLGRASGLALSLVRRPRLQWGALLAASPALALGWALRAGPDIPDWQPDPGLVAASQPVPIRPVRACHAYTDAGQAVTLYRAAGAATAEDLRASDASVLAAGSYAARLIRTAPASDAYNCHGWVFTGGRYWVQGADVGRILHDNGYRPVTAPRPGDLVLYHDGPEHVTHSGVVHSAGPDGLVLVESKWGKGSRFLHPADRQPYFTSEWTFYRSGRTGHQLRGLGAAAGQGG